MSIGYFATREDMIRTLVRAGMVGAEIGVRRGEFSLEFLKLPIAMIHLVDAWSDGAGEPAPAGDHESNYAATLHNLRGHLPGGRVTITRGKSVQVAAHWPFEHQLDFVYIDACHEYGAVLDDLRHWCRIVKPGGLIMGHDYTDTAPDAIRLKFGVVAAVKEFCRYRGLSITHLTRDEYPSFCLQSTAAKTL